LYSEKYLKKNTMHVEEGFGVEIFRVHVVLFLPHLFQLLLAAWMV
jgi:hypothetical protein